MTSESIFHVYLTYKMVISFVQTMKGSGFYCNDGLDKQALNKRKSDPVCCIVEPGVVTGPTVADPSEALPQGWVHYPCPALFWSCFSARVGGPNAAYVAHLCERQATPAPTSPPLRTIMWQVTPPIRQVRSPLRANKVRQQSKELCLSFGYQAGIILVLVAVATSSTSSGVEQGPSYDSV